MILESILGIVTGLGGSIATGILNFKTQKQKNAHELEMIKAETNAMIAETEANIKVTELDVQRDIEMASIESFNTSQIVGNRVNVTNSLIEKLFERKWTTIFGVILVFLLGTVDVLRSAMRPAITIALMLITAKITYQSMAIITENTSLITAEQVYELISAIIYLTFSVVGWWFGDRAISKFKTK